MEKRMQITTHDYERLTDLLEDSFLTSKMPEVARQLQAVLTESRKISQDLIAANVITMNSRVLLKDLKRNVESELTITYPHDAESRARKVSVLSPIGIALLGRHVGDVVSWKTPLGYGSFEILKVTYQPEAVGDYSL